MCAMLIITLTGCEEKGNASNRTSNNSGSVEDVLAQGMNDVPDVDLTVLSSTMVYSEVFNMMYYPENYIGKTVKMSGMYTMFHDENTGKYYHGCIVKDATACCAQGIEFELTDDYVYPDDYPDFGADICVVGTFETYKEGDNTFCTLRNAKRE